MEKFDPSVNAFGHEKNALSYLQNSPDNTLRPGTATTFFQRYQEQKTELGRILPPMEPSRIIAPPGIQNTNQSINRQDGSIRGNIFSLAPVQEPARQENTILLPRIGGPIQVTRSAGLFKKTNMPAQPTTPMVSLPPLLPHPRNIAPQLSSIKIENTVSETGERLTKTSVTLPSVAGKRSILATIISREDSKDSVSKISLPEQCVPAATPFEQHNQEPLERFFSVGKSLEETVLENDFVEDDEDEEISELLRHSITPESTSETSESGSEDAREEMEDMCSLGTPTSLFSRYRTGGKTAAPQPTRTESPPPEQTQFSRHNRLGLTEDEDIDVESMADITREPSFSEESRPKEEPPVHSVLCVNIPRSVFVEGPDKCVEHLIKNKAGNTYYKLAALLGNVCFQQSLPIKKRAASKKGKRGSEQVEDPNIPKMPTQIRKEDHERSIRSQPMPHALDGDDRRRFNAELDRLRRGREDDADREGYAEEEGRQPSPGCFFYMDDRDEDIENEFPHTSHMVEGVYSKTGVFLWLRIFYIIHNPGFEMRTWLVETLRSNIEGKQRDSQKTGVIKPRAAFDYKGDWRLFRKVTTPQTYGKVIESYTKIKGIGRGYKTYKDITHPEHILDIRSPGALEHGLSPVDIRSADPKYLHGGRYFDDDGKFVLVPDGKRVLYKDISCMNPCNIVHIYLPPDVIRVDSKESSIGESDAAVEANQAIREAMDTIYNHNNDEPFFEAYSKLIEIRDSTTGGASVDRDSLLTSFDYDTGETHGWNVEESPLQTEVEITNKSLRHRAINHSLRVDIGEKFTKGTDEYVAAMAEFQADATDRLVDDILKISEEKDQWPDAFFLVFKWLKIAMSSPDTFWPINNRVAKNIGIYGNAMIKDIQSFIHAFQLEAGWKPREMQKYLVVNLNVYDYRFDIHMNNILSGGASMGKSKILEEVIKCRILDTIIQTSSITEKTLTTDAEHFLTHKTLIFEEAPPWLLGMDDEGNTAKVQSHVLKDVLARSASLSMRNHWDSEEGKANLAVTKTVLMINILAATNSGYPSKDSPLMRRMMVDDVVFSKLNSYGVRDIAWTLSEQNESELEAQVRHDQKVRQGMHVLAELFIMSGVISDVNLDIPVLLMSTVFEYLRDNYDISMPDIRMMGMVLKGCRVETIQHAIRVAYFSEIGQLKHQFVTKEDPVTGVKTIVLDSDGKPVKKPLDFRTVPEEIEPLLYCQEDTFAYVMMMLKTHLVPCVVGEVKNAITKLVLMHNPQLMKTGNKKIMGNWYETFDSNYYQIEYANKEKFYSDIVQLSGDRINRVTARTVVGEICDKPMMTTRLSPVMRASGVGIEGDGPVAIQPQEGSSNGVIVPSCGSVGYEIVHRDMEMLRMHGSKAMTPGQKRSKRSSRITVSPIKFRKTKDGNGFLVCIARCMVEHDIPNNISLINSATGGLVRGKAKAVNYETAMREALTYTMSHYSTRPRRVIVSDDLVVNENPYPEILAYIDIKRNPKRVVMKRHHLAPQSGRDMFLGYSYPTKHRTNGYSAPIQIAMDDLESVVARNHARNVGLKFNPIALPEFQEMVITSMREELPGIFDNETIQYPHHIRLLMDEDNARTHLVMNAVKDAAENGTLETLMQDPKFQGYMLSNAGELACDEYDSAGEEDDIRIISEAIAEEREYMHEKMSTSAFQSSTSRKGKENITAAELEILCQETAETMSLKDETLKNIQSRKSYRNHMLRSKYNIKGSSLEDTMVAPDKEAAVQAIKKATYATARSTIGRITTGSSLKVKKSGAKARVSRRMGYMSRLDVALEKRRDTIQCDKMTQSLGDVSLSGESMEIDESSSSQVSFGLDNARLSGSLSSSSDFAENTPSFGAGRIQLQGSESDQCDQPIKIKVFKGDDTQSLDSSNLLKSSSNIPKVVEAEQDTFDMFSALE